MQPDWGQSEEVTPQSLRVDGQGRKDDDGKVPLDLLSPDFLEGIATVLGYGAGKYAPYNWAKGISYSRVYAAMQRHLNDWWAGEEKDDESEMSHLWHAGCCLMFLIHYHHPNNQEKYKVFDDRPNYAEAAQSPS